MGRGSPQDRHDIALQRQDREGEERRRQGCRGGGCCKPRIHQGRLEEEYRQRRSHPFCRQPDAGGVRNGGNRRDKRRCAYPRDVREPDAGRQRDQLRGSGSCVGWLDRCHCGRCIFAHGATRQLLYRACCSRGEIKGCARGLQQGAEAGASVSQRG